MHSIEDASSAEHRFDKNEMSDEERLGSSLLNNNIRKGKIADESQVRRLVNAGKDDPERGLNIVMDERHHELMMKTRTVIKMMNRYHPSCSIRFL